MPGIWLSVAFGLGLGIKKSSAQPKDHYTTEDLRGRQVLAVAFPPKRIASFESEVLVLGVPDEEGAVVLIAPDREAPLGVRIF